MTNIQTADYCFFFIQPITITHLITASLHCLPTPWWHALHAPQKQNRNRFFLTIMTQKTSTTHWWYAKKKISVWVYKHCVKQLRNINSRTNRQNHAMSFRGGKLFLNERKIIHFSANCKKIKNSFSVSISNNALKLPLWLYNDFRTVPDKVEGWILLLTYLFKVADKSF